MLKINGKIITKNSKICRNTTSKFLGLMFSREIKNRSLIFTFSRETIVSLHMFFVFYPIDVIFADSDKKIIEIKRNFKPFNFYTPKRRSKYIIELPLGKEFKLGDKISFS